MAEIRFSDTELKEFEELINKKLDQARSDFEQLQRSLSYEDDNRTEDIPGWLVAGEGGLTVALDIEITPELRAEGLARELVNRIQQRRKDAGLEVTDRIALTLDGPAELQDSVASNLDYIRTETLAEKLEWASVDAGVEREELEPQLTVGIAMVAIH